jgi:hypothetical protein
VVAEEGAQALGVLVAGPAQAGAHRLLDQLLLVVEEELGDREGVVDVPLPDHVGRRIERRASLPHVLRARELVQRRAVAVGQVAADHERRREPLGDRRGAEDDGPRARPVARARRSRRDSSAATAARGASRPEVGSTVHPSC